MEHTLTVLAVVLVGIPAALLLVVGVWAMLFMLVVDLWSSVSYWWRFTASRWFRS